MKKFAFLAIASVICFASYGQTNVGIGTNAPLTKLDVSGAISVREGSALSLSAGNNNNIALPTVPTTSDVAGFCRITAPTTGVFTITGVVPNTSANGQIVTLINTTGKVMTVANASASSSAANRIYTQTGANLTDNASATATSTITMQYSQNAGGSAVPGWVVTATQNFITPSGTLVTNNVVAGAASNSVSVTNGNNQVVGGSNLTINVAKNGVGQDGVVPGTATPANNNQVWGTNGSGVPAWGSVSNAQLANSGISVSGTGIGVSGSPVALGGTVTLTNTGVTSLTSTSPLTVNTAATGGVTVNLTGTVPVANGGTGDNTLAAGGVLYGNGTGNVLVTPAPSSGQILVGNTTTPSFVTMSGDATISNTGAITLTGGGSGNGYIKNLAGTTPQSANFNIQSAAAANVGGVIKGAASQSADLLDFQNSSATVLASVDKSGNINAASGTASSSTTTGAVVVTGGEGISGNLNVGGTEGVAGVASFTSNTASSSTGTGAVVVTGGEGIGGNLNVGGNQAVTGTETVTGLTTLNGGLTETGAINLNASGATNPVANINTSSTGTVTIGDGSAGNSTVSVTGLAASSAVYTSAGGLLTTATPSGTALGYWTESGTTIYNNPNTGTGFVGIGTNAAPTAQLQIKQAVATSGTPTAFLLSGGAHTTLAASTEATDVNFNLARTVQFATGALATQRAVRFQAPTYSFVGASTISNAATVDISGPPVAGTNATITNPASLIVETGNVGIGTTSPSSLFSVGSTSQFQVNSSGAIAAATGIISSGTIQFSGLNGGSSGSLVAASSTGVLSIAGTSTTLPLSGGTGITIGASNTINSYWTLNGSNNLYNNNSGGQVGIGTNGPEYKLHVVTSSGNTDGITVQNIAGGAGATSNITMETYADLTTGVSHPGARISAIDDGAYSAHLTFNTKVPSADANALAERMRITSAGLVGIGTNNPAGMLHVITANSNGNVSAWGTGQMVVGSAGTTGGALGFGFSTDNGGTGWISSLAPSIQWEYLGYRASNHIFYIGGTTEGMRLTSTGALAFNGATNYGTTGNQLFSNGNAAPTWSALNLAGGANYITGILPVANGGTGSSTQGWVDLTTNQTAAGNKTWSGISTFTPSGGGSASAIIASAAGPSHAWDATGQATDQKWWDMLASGTTFLGRTVNDANSAATVWLQVNRGSGYTLSSVTFPNSSVGIGTTTPQTTLEVSAATTDLLKVTSTTGGAGNHAYIDFVTFGTPTNNYVDARIGAIDMGSNNGSLVFETGNQGTSSTTTTERMRILNTGNVGIGTTTPVGLLELKKTTQLQANLVLSGQEYYQSGNSATGIALMAGVNRSGNKQLWIADEDNIASPNSTNAVIRISPGLGYGYMDAIATNGTTSMNMVMQGLGGYVGIGITPSYALDVLGNGRFNNGSGTYVYVGGGGGAYYGDGTNMVVHMPTGGNFYMANVGTDGTRVSQSTGTLRVGGPSQTSSNLYVYGSEGIGTTSPSYLLDVNSPSAAQANIGLTTGSSSTGSTSLTNIQFNDWWAGTKYTSEVNFDFYGNYYSNVSHGVNIKSGRSGYDNVWFRDANNNVMGGFVNASYGGSATLAMTDNFVLGGKLGVGTNTPSTPLYVVGAGILTGELYVSNTGATPGGSSTGSILLGDGTISKTYGSGFMFNSTVIANGTTLTSDERIKNVIGVSNGAADLQTLNNIKITDYKMRDQLRPENAGLFKKVIAQQVKSIFPQAVKMVTAPQVIPDIYQMAQSFNIHDSNVTVVLAKPVEANKDVKPGSICKFIMNEKAGGGEKEMKGLITGINGNELSLKMQEKVEADKYDNRLFVYGTEINDLLAVDYDAISMLNVSATQELAKQLAEANCEIEQLKNENSKLQQTTQATDNKYSQLKAQVDALKELMEKNGIRSEK